MSKDQVSGSLTLSLSGLADAVAERVTETLRAEMHPQVPIFQREAVIGVLTGLGVPYDLAAHVAEELPRYQMAIVSTAPPEEVTAVPRLLAPEEVDQESAVAWFKKEVGL